MKKDYNRTSVVLMRPTGVPGRSRWVLAKRRQNFTRLHGVASHITTITAARTSKCRILSCQLVRLLMGRPSWAGIAPRTKQRTNGCTEHNPWVCYVKWRASGLLTIRPQPAKPHCGIYFTWNYHALNPHAIWLLWLGANAVIPTE